VAERNNVDLARSVTALTEDLGQIHKPIHELHTDREVRKERDTNLNQRLDRIEKSIDAVYGLGKWVLAAISMVLLTAGVTFIVNGGIGLNVGP
jgi:hypothetical protein